MRLEPVLIRPIPGDNSPTAILFGGVDALKALDEMKGSSVHSVITELPIPGTVEGMTPTVWERVSYQPLPSAPIFICEPSTTPFGGEETVEDFIGHFILFCRKLQRVLRPDGTFWFHVRDRYTADKQLAMIPQRAALALQAEGWILRNEIIWQKDNTTPESAKDRLTRTHGTLFFFAHPDSKKEGYFYDADAIREPHTSKDEKHTQSYNKTVNMGDGFARRPEMDKAWHPKGRNRRTVWSVNLGAYLGKSVSPWPKELVEPMVWASVSQGGCCPDCGAQFIRGEREKWVPSCSHEKAPIRSTVLDPFAGTAVTGKVAIDWGANFIGIDLDPEVLSEARARLEGLTHSRRALQEKESPILDLFYSGA